MPIISKQLIINSLNLPKVMIDIIKDYVFYNIINKTIKNKKNNISLLFNKWKIM